MKAPRVLAAFHLGSRGAAGVGIGVSETWGGTLPSWGDPIGGFPTSAHSLLPVIRGHVQDEEADSGVPEAHRVRVHTSGPWRGREMKKCWKGLVCFNSCWWDRIEVHPWGYRCFWWRLSC